MKQSKTPNSRRAFLKTSILGLGALGTSAATLASPSEQPSTFAGAALKPDPKPPGSDIRVWVTNMKQRFAAGTPIPWLPAAPSASTTPSTESVRLVDANKFQDILGFGGCFSDAACYVFNQLREPAREHLLHEMFHPSEMGLSVHRTCIGSADSAAMLYSYDEGEPDP
jgi:hypothetical protein